MPKGVVLGVIEQKQCLNPASVYPPPHEAEVGVAAEEGSLQEDSSAENKHQR